MSKADIFNTRGAASVKYAEQRKHPKWLDRRVTILTRDKMRCQKCWSGKEDGVPLHVHHLYYVKGRDYWDYPDFALMTLCEKCHELAHDQEDYANGMFEEWERFMESAFQILPEFPALHDLFLMCASYIQGKSSGDELLGRVEAVFESVRNSRERMASSESLGVWQHAKKMAAENEGKEFEF